MAENRPHVIALGDLKNAVAAAVKQVKDAKVQTDLAKAPLIMGRWIRDARLGQSGAQSELDTAAKEITDQVKAAVHGLNAEPFALPGHGGATIGFQIREQ